MKFYVVLRVAFTGFTGSWNSSIRFLRCVCRRTAAFIDGAASVHRCMFQVASSCARDLRLGHSMHAFFIAAGMVRLLSLSQTRKCTNIESNVVTISTKLDSLRFYSAFKTFRTGHTYENASTDLHYGNEKCT